MRYLVCAATNVGRVRKNNEDNFSLDHLYLNQRHENNQTEVQELSPEQAHLLGVYDGMGGHSDGEMASFLTAQTAAGYLQRLNEPGDPARILTDLCMEANDQVCGALEGSNMGTTCVMLYLRGENYVVCNVGDSPLFLLREGTLYKLSFDHNQRATWEMATGRTAAPNQKFPLTQCIGIPKDEMLIEPYTVRGELEDGDMFLLCSDGITDMLSQETVRTILSGPESVDVIARELIRQAMEAGGKDNATVICARISREEASEAEATQKSAFFKNLFRKIV